MKAIFRILTGVTASLGTMSVALAQTDVMVKSDLPQKTIGNFSGPGGNAGVAEEVIHEIALAGEFPGVDGLANQRFRARMVMLQPGGVIGIHEHKARPNYFRVMTGEITYHGPDGVRVYREGDEVEEFGAIPHWWTNAGQYVVTLYAVDVRDMSKDAPK